jgi:hypothetical protein
MIRLEAKNRFNQRLGNGSGGEEPDGEDSREEN